MRVIAVVVVYTTSLPAPYQMAGKVKHAPTSAVVYGYLHDGYAFGAHRSDRDDRGFDFNLFRAPIEANRKSQPEFKRFTYSDIGLAPSIYRWRIARDCFWATSNGVRVNGASVMRLSLDDLSYFDPANASGQKDYRFKHHDSAWYMDPVADVAIEYQRRAYDGFGGFLPDYNKHYDDVVFDLLPWDKDMGLLFVLEGDTMRVWYAAGKQHTGAAQEWELEWTELKDQRFTTDMREPFMTYAKGKDYYFVTRSGKIYLSRKPKGKEERKCETLWANPKSPVRAVIVDVDNDNYFAFTGPATEGDKDAKSVYFELGDKDATKPYELKSADAKGDKRLKFVLEYTQVLLDDNKIKLPKEGERKK